MTENLSASELAELGFSAVAYPFTLVAAKLKSIRETLQALKASMPIGPPPLILSAEEVCRGVGFNDYWVCHSTALAKAEEHYQQLTLMGRTLKIDTPHWKTWAGVERLGQMAMLGPWEVQNRTWWGRTSRLMALTATSNRNMYAVGGFHLVCTIISQETGVDSIINSNHHLPNQQARQLHR